jgi:hypothetical protein
VSNNEPTERPGGADDPGAERLGDDQGRGETLRDADRSGRVDEPGTMRDADDRSGGVDRAGTEPARPEQPRDEGFAEGEADPAHHPEDERVGRFSTGEEALPEDTLEKQRQGRFSEGEEVLGEEDPEKHAEGRFSEGLDHQPREGEA